MLRGKDDCVLFFHTEWKREQKLSVFEHTQHKLRQGYGNELYLQKARIKMLYL